MFNFTPLAGAKHDSAASQSLLELDGGIRILIDVGWDHNFDVKQLKSIEDVTQSLSFILLTHATIEHIGAYAHCCKHIPHFHSIPVYATKPVIALGRTLLQDVYASSIFAATVIPPASLLEATYNSTFAPSAEAPRVLLQPPTAKEITAYFQKIEPLEYNQSQPPHPSLFSPPLDGLTITALNAGHTLGGSIWHIQYGHEVIVYAVDWNQAKDNILSNAEWLDKSSEVVEQLRRPSALVCSSRGAENESPPGGRRKRDETLLAQISETMQQGGTVLIPTDSSARILELSYILEQHWRQQVAGPHADLYKSSRWTLATKSANTTLRLARSLVSWMDKSVNQEMTLESLDNSEGSGAFDFKHVKVIERLSRLEKLLDAPGPKVILASDNSLKWGLASRALRKLCSEPRNLVVMTERPVAIVEGEHDHRQRLWSSWMRRNKGEAIVRPSGLTLAFDDVHVTALQGEELTSYRQYQARERRIHGDVEDTTASDLVADVAEGESSSSEEESDNEDEDGDGAGTAAQQGRALNTTASMTQIKRRQGLTEAELGVNILLRSKNVFDYNVQGKKGRDRMFPFVARRTKDDEYGEVIGADDYLRAEERDDLDGQQTNLDGKDGVPAIGQKRKWGDVATTQKTNETKRNKSKDDIKDKPDDAGSDESESESEGDNDLADGPRKAIVTPAETLPLTMGVSFVDFSALHEKRDLHMLIPLIAPRKLILTGGGVSETEALARDCRSLLAPSNGEDAAVVLTPSLNETVDASVDTNAWEVKLSRELVKRLAWQHVRGLSVVAVTGRLDSVRIETEISEASRANKKLKMIENPEMEADDTIETKIEPVLDVVATSTGVAHTVSTQPIHVGDLRLVDLRRWMNASNLKAEFTGQGTLLVEGNVIVRKNAGGTIEVEGSPAVLSVAAAAAAGGTNGTLGPRGKAGPLAANREATFFAVRQKIYEGLAVVAGG